MIRPVRPLFCALILGVAVCASPGVARAADHPFKGDYAAKFTFTNGPKGGKGGTSQGLLVISINDNGQFLATYLNKTANYSYFIKGTIDKDGRFEGRVFFEGKDWGVHRGTFTRADNGNIKAKIDETPNGRPAPWGSYEIAGGTTIGESK